MTAITAGHGPDAVARMMLAAATDHVFLDIGHTVDFTNKAFEALDHVGWERAAAVLPTLVDQTAAAQRAEEGERWRHPVDLAALVARHRGASCPTCWPRRGRPRRRASSAPAEVAAPRPRRPRRRPRARGRGHPAPPSSSGAAPHQLGQAVAYAAALRIARFHVQNDFGDWDVVHHGFTHANALHQCLLRHPSPELVRGVVHAALRIYLDRFLNVPAARPPTATTGDLADLQACWDEQGGVDRAGAIAYGYLRGGGDPAALVAALGHALLAEDAGFHWFQIVEAAVRQFHAWPAGSEEGRHDPGGRGPLPRRPHAHPPRAPPRRPHRQPPPPRRRPLRGVTPGPALRTGDSTAPGALNVTSSPASQPVTLSAQRAIRHQLGGPPELG